MSTALPSSSPDAMRAYVILLDPDGRRMLTHELNGRLPAFDVRPVFYPEVEDLVRVARKECGLDIAILRCLEAGDANEGKPRLYSAICTSENVESSPGFKWTGLDEPNFDRSDKAALGNITQLEVERLSSPTLVDSPVPWDSPTGWHQAALNWLEANLPPSHEGKPWQSSQIRSWSISSVWRATSAGTHLYFKASPRYFASEVAVTLDVADRFPNISPSIVAAQPENGWMLMQDLGDVTLSAIDTAEIWHDTMKTIAKVQHGYVGKFREMERMGIERRTTEAVVEMLVNWTDDPADVEIRTVGEENEAALSRLGPDVCKIESIEGKLKELGIPATLEHGDLDATNVFIRNGSPVLMDWSDACVSHPFFTPLTPDQARRHSEFVDTYLREWTSYGPLENLRRGFQFAKPLAALESAFHYHRNIVPYLPYPYPDFMTLERYIPALLNMAADALEYVPEDE